MGIRWDPRKSEWLKSIRGISFEEILLANFIATEGHPKRKHQDLMLFELDGYVWVVPYVRNGEDIFLKTLYPSRLYTKRWMGGEFK